MEKRYLAFAEGFTAYMKMRGGWPTGKHIAEWIRTNYGGFTTGADSAFRTGSYTREAYIAGVIEMIIQNPPEYPQCERARRVLLDYLKPRGFSSVSIDQLDAILRHLCKPPLSTLPEDESKQIDYLWQGIRSIPAYLTGRAIRDNVLGCAYPSEVHEAITWMYACVGQWTAPNGGLLSEAEAIDVGCAVIKLPLAEYKRRAAEWWEFNPWTVLRARHGSAGVGMTIVLPVTEAAYRDVLTGKRPTYSCSPSDFQIPSRWFLLEACAERREYLQNGRINCSRPLFMCLAMQLGILSQWHQLEKGTQVHWLSFAGTPRARERMLNTEFRVTGNNMAVTGVELLERTVRAGAQRGLRFLENNLLLWASRYAPSSPPLGPHAA